jgi:hypothetical protein
MAAEGFSAFSRSKPLSAATAANAVSRTADLGGFPLKQAFPFSCRSGNKI